MIKRIKAQITRTRVFNVILLILLIANYNAATTNLEAIQRNRRDISNVESSVRDNQGLILSIDVSSDVARSERSIKNAISSAKRSIESSIMLWSQ